MHASTTAAVFGPARDHLLRACALDSWKLAQDQSQETEARWQIGSSYIPWPFPIHIDATQQENYMKVYISATLAEDSSDLYRHDMTAGGKTRIYTFGALDDGLSSVKKKNPLQNSLRIAFAGPYPNNPRPPHPCLGTRINE